MRTDGKTIERRFGEKNATKVAAEIERSKANDLWRLIYGLGIRHIGERGAQVLARAFGSIDALVNASLEQLQATHEIGPVLAESLRSWLDEPRTASCSTGFEPPVCAWKCPRRNGTPSRRRSHSPAEPT